MVAQFPLSSVFEGVGAYQSGLIDEEDLTRTRTIWLSYLWFLLWYVYSQLHELFAEGLGLALPGNGTILAVAEERKEFR